jgi:hypothetical protein
VYDDTIYNFCARARFPGCSYLRHIILGLNTVQRFVLSVSEHKRRVRSARTKPYL